MASLWRCQIDACIMCPIHLSVHPIAAAALEADSGRRLLWRGARSGECVVEMVYVVSVSSHVLVSLHPGAAEILHASPAKVITRFRPSAVMHFLHGWVLKPVHISGVTTTCGNSSKTTCWSQRDKIWKDHRSVKRSCFAHSFCKAPWSFGRTVQEVKLSLSNSSGFTSVFAASSAPHSPAEGLLTTAHVRSLRMCVALRTGAHVFPEPPLEATMSEEFMMMWSQRSFSP